jgi:hypothetical protein
MAKTYPLRFLARAGARTDEEDSPISSGRFCLTNYPFLYTFNPSQKFLSLKVYTGHYVVYEDIDEYSRGVTVTLGGVNTKTKTATDNFCDFEFKGLPDNTAYTVKIEAAAYRPQKSMRKLNGMSPWE